MKFLPLIIIFAAAFRPATAYPPREVPEDRVEFPNASGSERAIVMLMERVGRLESDQIRIESAIESLIPVLKQMSNRVADPGERLVILKALTVFAPSDVNVLNNYGIRLHEAGRYADALRTFDRSLAFNDKDPLVHIARGKSIFYLGGYEQARSANDYSFSYEDLPNDDEQFVPTNLGAAVVDQNLMQNALDAFDRSIALDGRRAYAYHNRGNVLFYLNRLEEAIAAYDQAIALDPNQPLVHDHRGTALYYLGRFEDAIAAFDRSINLNGNIAAVHEHRGNALLLLDHDDGDDAVEAYERSIALDSNKPHVHNNLANLYLNFGSTTAALAHYDISLAFNPNNPIFHDNRGVALVVQRRYPPHALEAGDAQTILLEALSAHDKAIELDALNPNFHYHRAEVLKDLGRLEEALAAADQSIALDGRISGFHLKRGEILAALGRLNDALETYNHCLELRPSYSWCHSRRADALVELQQYDEAIRSYDVAIELEPHDNYSIKRRRQAIAAQEQLFKRQRLE